MDNTNYYNMGLSKFMKPFQFQYKPFIAPTLPLNPPNSSGADSWFWKNFGTGEPPQYHPLGPTPTPPQPRMVTESKWTPYQPNLNKLPEIDFKPQYSGIIDIRLPDQLKQNLSKPRLSVPILKPHSLPLTPLPQQNTTPPQQNTTPPQQNTTPPSEPQYFKDKPNVASNTSQPQQNQSKPMKIPQEEDNTGGGKYDFNTFKTATGGLDTGAFLGTLVGNLGAGAVGLGGNLIQTALLRRFQPDYKEIVSQQGNLFDQLMGKYGPQFTTNRLGQFGEEAAAEAQRRSLEPTYSPAAIANMAAAQSSASALENLGSILGSQALQNQQMQTANLMRNLQGQARQMGATPAALSAMARAASEQQGQNLAQALSAAAQAASQNIAQAAALRGQGLQGLESSAQRVYETYKRPAETMTDYGALVGAASTPYRQGLQIGESLTVMPANPLKPMGDIWAGLTNAAAEQSQYQKRMQIVDRNLSNINQELMKKYGITEQDVIDYIRNRQQQGT
jgi:hypothetical protein